MTTGLGQFLEPTPGGGIGPVGVAALGVPEAGGDGLRRLPVVLRQLQGAGEPLVSGQVGRHEDPGKTPDAHIITGFTYPDQLLWRRQKRLEQADGEGQERPSGDFSWYMSTPTENNPLTPILI